MATTGWTVAAAYAGINALGMSAPIVSWWAAAAACFGLGLWLSIKGPSQ